jgi:hypothetical protein
MKAEDKIRDEIIRKRNIALQTRKDQLPIWLETINVFCDRFFVQWKDFNAVFTKEKNIEDVRFVEAIPANIGINAYHIFLSSLLSIPHNFLVTPKKTDTLVIQASYRAEQVLNSLIAPKFAKIKLDLMTSLLLTSRTLVKIYWDKNVGELVEFPLLTDNPSPNDIPYTIVVNGQEYPAQIGGKQLFQKVDSSGNPILVKTRLGDINFAVVPPINYLIDPFALGSADALNPDSSNPARWIIHFFLVDEEWCEENNIKFEGGELQKYNLRDFYPELRNMTIKGAIYQEYYERPERKNNYEGRFVKMLNDKIISVEPLPKFCQEKGVLPFVDFADDPSPFTWYNRSIISRITPLQKKYAELEALLNEVCRKIGRVRVFLNRGAGDLIFHEVEDDIIEEVVEYGGNQPPVQVVMNDLPQYALQYLELILRDIQLITIHDPRFPLSSSRTATELNLTSIMDEQKLSIIKYYITDKISLLGRYALQMLRENYHIGRMVRVMNDFYMSETLFFHPDLFLPEDYDIQVEIGTPFYLTQTAKYQFFIQGVQLGLFDPLELLEVMYGSPIQDAETFIHMKVAGEENFRLLVSNEEFMKAFNLKAQLLEAEKRNLTDMELQELLSILKMGIVEPIHNHLIHAKVHRKFLNKYASQLSEFALKKGIQHYLEHLQYLQPQIEEAKSRTKAGGGEHGTQEEKERS